MPLQEDQPVVEDALVPLIGHLARMGLVFRKGLPPREEGGPVLVWTGGCNALLVEWRPSGSLTEVGSGGPVRLEQVEVWMRLPHPFFWPIVEAEGSVMPLQDVHSIETVEALAWHHAVQRAEIAA